MLFENVYRDPDDVGSAIVVLEQRTVSLDEWKGVVCQNVVDIGLGSQIVLNPHQITPASGVERCPPPHPSTTICWSLLDTVGSESLISTLINSEAPVMLKERRKLDSSLHQTCRQLLLSLAMSFGEQCLHN